MSTIKCVWQLFSNLILELLKHVEDFSSSFVLIVTMFCTRSIKNKLFYYI